LRGRQRNVPRDLHDGTLRTAGRIAPAQAGCEPVRQLLANTGDHGLGLCRHLPVIAAAKRRQRSCRGPPCRHARRTRDYWSRVMITLEKTPRIEYGSYGEPDVGPPISVALIWARIWRRKWLIAVSST